MADDTTTGSIFVSIASYRDTECPATLGDLFAKAAHPERVFAGVLWQLAHEDGEEFTHIPSHQENVRGLQVDWSKSLGACWARSQIQSKLWDGEEYYLQIDSHSRFDQDWDVKLIKMLHSCPSEKPVLSTHPNQYHPPDKLIIKGYPYLRAKKFNKDGILIPKGRYINVDKPPPLPPPAALLGGGFVFAAGSMVREVPYDPYLYFQGEEISMAVRLFSHGYDLYTPNDVIIYHDYTDRKRQRHWHDHKQDWSKIHDKAKLRLNHIFAIQPSTDPEIIKELDRYGLGTVRSLQEFETYADLDLARQRIGVRGSDGHYPKAPATVGIRAEITRKFTDIYVNNQWGATETRSGSGSTLLATVELRRDFQALLQRLKVRTLVDAGCGDVAWLQHISSSLDLYLGYDAVEEMITHNRTMFAAQSNHLFGVADIASDILPRGDAILCRNTLTHLPNGLVSQVLQNFKRSESRFLIATTTPGAENGDSKLAQWRKLDLNASPFSLPKPKYMLKDGSSKYNRFLGVWDFADF